MQRADDANTHVSKFRSPDIFSDHELLAVLIVN